MISYFLVRFFQRQDEEMQFQLTLNGILLAVVTEGLLFMGYLGTMQGAGGLEAILKSLLTAVYWNVTAWVDLLTGCVYVMVNRLVFLICCLLLLRDGLVSILGCLSFLFFWFFVILCERKGAFCKGDSEFLMVSYCLFEAIPGMKHHLEWMLLMMFFSSVYFGIFRKLAGRKEESIPYTPFLVFSEYIILILLVLLPEKEVYGTI